MLGPGYARVIDIRSNPGNPALGPSSAGDVSTRAAITSSFVKSKAEAKYHQNRLKSPKQARGHSLSPRYQLDHHLNYSRFIMQEMQRWTIGFKSWTSTLKPYKIRSQTKVRDSTSTLTNLLELTSYRNCREAFQDVVVEKLWWVKQSNWPPRKFQDSNALPWSHWRSSIPNLSFYS